MNNRYEAVVIYLPELDDQNLKSHLDKLGSVVSAHGGSIEKQDVWGRKALAYKIRKQTFGIYVLTVFDGDRDLVADLDRQLKINDSVIRHLIVAKDKFAPDAAHRIREDEDMSGMGGIGGDDFDADEGEEATL